MSGQDAHFRVAFTVIFTLLTALRVGARVWSRTVRENFSPTLRLRPNHSLVMMGLYGRARHPMYWASSSPI